MGLTPTEQKIMDLLSDGARHNIRDMCVHMDCNIETLRMHITNLRKKIKELGWGIAHLSDNGQAYYFHSRQVSIKGE